MKCRKHPAYKVLRKPTAECEQCRMMWEQKTKENKDGSV